MYKYIIITCLLFVSGCASDGVDLVDSYSEKNNGIPIYGKLEKVGNSYKLTSYSLFIPSKNEAWVRLNDGFPMWDTTTQNQCHLGSGILGLYDGMKGKCETNPKLFRTYSPSVVQTAVTAVFSMGIAITAPQGAVIFDENSFHKAYKQATKKLLKQIINTANSMQTSYESLQNNKQSIRENYQQQSNNIPLNFIVENKTNLLINDFNAKQLIKINHRVNFTNPLPWKFSASTLQELKTKVLSYEKDKLQAWNTYGSTLHLDCQNIGGFSYNYKYLVQFTCPKNIPISSPMAKIKLKILGKTVKLKPQISGSDKNISFIEMNNIHQFYITNKTSAFMKIQKVAFYYQKQIYTLNTQLELSPLAGKTLNLENFEYGFNNGKGFVFKNMTAMKAKKQNIFLGFAISYEINGRNNTFFKKINKSLYHFNTIN